MPVAPGTHRAAWGVFAVLFLFYAYFFQGSGWNQSARFDQVRAVVEGGTLAVDDYLVQTVEASPDGRLRFRRTPVDDALRGESGAGPPFNTYDLSYFDDRYYPNKPPGVTLLGVPVYWVLYQVGRAAGADADEVGIVFARAYLVSVATVGLLGALTGAVFLRLSRRLFPKAGAGRHVLSALALGLATPMFPYATAFFDHVPAAFFLLLAFALLVRERQRGDAGPRRGACLLAGLAAGAAVVTSYAALLGVAALAAYACATFRPRARAVWFLAGGVPPALVLLAYHAACFGAPFTVANAYQSEVFVSERNGWLGIFGAVDFGVLVRLLVSPYRGLFPAAPVLLAAVFGLVLAARRRAIRAEVAVCVAIPVAFLLMNASFNGWNGGYAFGPRYLVPALPFLALPLALAWDFVPRITAALAAVSFAILLLVTSVLVMVPQEFDFPLRDAILPLALGRTVENPYCTYVGPVSASPLESYPGYPGVAAADAFNLGELLWPRSWASLLPLAVLAVAAAGVALRRRASRLWSNRQ